MEDAFNMEDTYELDRLIAATPGSASIASIASFADSDTRHQEKVAMEEVKR